MNKKNFISFLYVIIASCISAFAIYYFVYPGFFPPVGVDGIATMLSMIFFQSSDNTSIFILAINIPLIIAAFFFLEKRFTLLTLLCIAITSGLLELFKSIPNFPQYNDNPDKLLAAIFLGALLGVRTGLLLKAGASSGGVDIIAGIIQRKNPYINFERYISLICYAIILCSFFVYGFKTEPVMLSCVQMFVFEKAASVVMQNLRNAVEFKIITDTPEMLKEDILSNLKHGATIVDSKGMYTGKGKSIIFCVVNTRQVPDFLRLLKKYENLFVYCSDVSSVNGNFRWHKEDIAK